MATLNDVLKEVLEKDFDKDDVEKVVDSPSDGAGGEFLERENDNSGNDDGGQSYAGPGEFAQNSVGRGAVESFIKNSIYEKYGIDSSAMRDYSKMTPTEMLSDFGKTVGDGWIQSLSRKKPGHMIRIRALLKNILFLSLGK